MNSTSISRNIARWAQNAAFWMAAVFATTISVSVAMPGLSSAIAADASPSFCVQPSPGTAWSVKISRVKREEEKDGQIRITPDQDQSKLELPVQLSVQTGRNGISLGKITYTNGRTESFYAAYGKVLVASSNSARVLVFPQDPLNPQSLRCSCFPATAWMTPKLERRVETHAGVPCIYYTYEEAVEGKMVGRIEGWLRQSDRYPVEVLADTNTLFKYGELTPFPEDIVLPPAFQQAVAKMQNRQAALDRIKSANARQAK